MTTQTMFHLAPAKTLGERLANTPLDPERGRQREFRVIYGLTLAVLLPVFAGARIVSLGRNGAGKGSVFQEARCAALSALAYAYRH